MDLTDRVLLKMAKKGSKQAFESLIRKYHPMVSRFAYGLTGDAEISTDVSQSVFMKLYCNLERFKITKAKLSTWLCQVAKNLCYNEFKVSNRFIPLDEQKIMESFEDSLADRIDLYNALAGLDKEHREVILLVKLNGFSYEEAAKVLEVPLGTVKSRLYHARKQLIDVLTPSKEMVK